MGFFDWITGGGKMAQDAVEAIIDTGDALVYTDEEKAAQHMTKLQWALEYLRTTSGQNLARRLIAVMVVGVWVLLVAVIAVAGYFDRTDDSYAAWMREFLENVLSNPFNIILGFYFLTGTMRALRTGT